MAPTTASGRLAKAPFRLNSKPSHTSGRVRLSGSRVVSRSMKASAISTHTRSSAPAVCTLAPHFQATAADSNAVSSYTSEKHTQIGVLQAEHRTHSHSHKNKKKKTSAKNRCPHWVQAERGSQRL